jgi:acyl-CoA synthetase (AMP-forming)/AMP-acid ligase II
MSLRWAIPVKALFRMAAVACMFRPVPEEARMATARTIPELLAGGAAEAPAILAPERPTLDRAGLRELATRTVASLNGVGVGRNDRVAIVLANGPEMAAAFVAVASGATTAPLNPAYREDELDFYLSDLRAKALIVAEDDDGPAAAVARRHGAAVLRLRVPDGAPAGSFALQAEAAVSGTPAQAGEAGPDDIGLVLHTSGTTSRPKIVPLTQANLVASAGHIAQTLRLTPEDRCLNIMPLFHIHGLMAATLASLGAGASLVAPGSFNALRFFAWIDEAKPTWYTAVPTMHQAILARAARNPEIIARSRLRFIRSSSASLPAPVMRELEAVFGCPVIESYGMTEAAHQMTSNLLPPGERKPGTVGVAAGPMVGTMDGSGALLPAGEVGEVVISGPNVTLGYEANPEANASAFVQVDGRRWFRTGDEGRFDESGFLTITGRIKEIINRGGEKVSPLEVDAILLEHPAVAQVVTFAMRHDKLGEEVAAAVVLQEGEVLDERAVRDFAATRLADFKVPRKVVFVAEIPKGATGKLQRIGLARRLGLEE